MSNFETAVTHVLTNEGGFINHPSDPGGATNYGISLRFLKTLPGMQNADINTVRNLTQEQAKGIYYQFFWTPNKYEKIHDQKIATKLLDFAVNMGQRSANILAQRAVRAVVGQVLVEDGILGTKSISAINIFDPKIYTAVLRSEAANYYRNLNNPDFIDGWLKRAYKDW